MLTRLKAGAVLDIGGNELLLEEGDKQSLASDMAQAKSKLIQKVIGADEIDASDVIEAIFPYQHSDVFISHSHKDVGLAMKVADALKKKGAKCFIDSLVWGSSEELLKAVDNKYCYQPEFSTYDYTMRNSSTAHVYMMLTTALQQMIASSTYFLFLRSDHSIKVDNILDDDKTCSPWIHMELNFSSLIMPRGIFVNKALSEDSRSLPIHHDAYTDHLAEKGWRDYLSLKFDDTPWRDFFE